MQLKEMNGSALAYLGDAVWSLLVREYLLSLGYSRAADLQKLSVRFVSAKAQAQFYTRLHGEAALSEQEEEIFRRGRNAKTGVVPKNTEVQTYRISTGFEALIGWWYLDGQQQRLQQIWHQLREQVSLGKMPSGTH